MTFQGVDSLAYSIAGGFPQPLGGNSEKILQVVYAERSDKNILCPQPVRPAQNLPLRPSPTGVLEVIPDNKDACKEFSHSSAATGIFSGNPTPVELSLSRSFILPGTKTMHSFPKSLESPPSILPGITGTHGSLAISGKNFIDLDRIAQGLDTRTTVVTSFILRLSYNAGTVALKRVPVTSPAFMLGISRQGNFLRNI